MGLSLTEAPPRTVEVNGAAVRVNWGWRDGVRVMREDDSTGEGRARILTALYADPVTGALPRAVGADPVAAYVAGVEWHAGAWEAMRYGKRAARGPTGAQRRILDWDADAAIVAADFLRLYRVDLTDPAEGMHWYRFVALLLAAAATPDALLSRAVGARGPMPPGAKGEARRRLEREREAWSLPPSAAEMRAAAAREFG